MDEEALLKYVLSQAVQVNIVRTTCHLGAGTGFAIPIPNGTTIEAMKAVGRKLIEVMYSFERVAIGGQEYYVLFPYG